MNMVSNVTSLKKNVGNAPSASVDRHFNIVVAGEFNAGKSSVVNLLLRRQVMPVTVGFTHMPPVRVFPAGQEAWHVLSAGNERLPEEDFLSGRIAGTSVRSARIELPLKSFNGATITEVSVGQHGELDPEAEAALQSADLLIWCTMGQRAWCLTEITVVEKLPPRLLRNAILAVTRIDYMDTAADRDKILTRLEREASRYFRAILPVGASQKALRNAADDNHWAGSGGQALHDHVMSEFSQSEHFGRAPQTAELEDIGKFRSQAPEKTLSVTELHELWQESLNDLEAWIAGTSGVGDKEVLGEIKSRLQDFLDTHFCVRDPSASGIAPLAAVFGQAIQRVSQEIELPKGRAAIGIDLVLQLEEEIHIRLSDTR